MQVKWREFCKLQKYKFDTKGTLNPVKLCRFVRLRRTFDCYPFGSETNWTRQLRKILGEWLTKGKRLTGARGYMGMIDPFNKLKK